MLSYGLLLCGVYAAATLDTVLAPVWAIGPVRPDLIALAALGWALVGGKSQAYLMAAAIGLFADLLVPGRLGVCMACFALVGYAAVHLQPQFRSLPVWVKAAVVAPAIAVQALGIGLLRSLCGEIQLDVLAMAVRCLGVGVYTAAIALPLLMLHDWVREPRWE